MSLVKLSFILICSSVSSENHIVIVLKIAPCYYTWLLSKRRIHISIVMEVIMAADFAFTLHKCGKVVDRNTAHPDHVH